MAKKTKPKATLLKPLKRTPASPDQVSIVANQIAMVLLDYTDDERHRIMVAASAIMGDADGVAFHAAQIEANDVFDMVCEGDD